MRPGRTTVNTTADRLSPAACTLHFKLGYTITPDSTVSNSVQKRSISIQSKIKYVDIILKSKHIRTKNYFNGTTVNKILLLLKSMDTDLYARVMHSKSFVSDESIPINCVFTLPNL